MSWKRVLAREWLILIACVGFGLVVWYISAVIIAESYNHVTDDEIRGKLGDLPASEDFESDWDHYLALKDYGRRQEEYRCTSAYYGQLCSDIGILTLVLTYPVVMVVRSLVWSIRQVRRKE